MAAMLITSCGGEVKKEFDVNPDGLTGGMSEYIEIAPGPYKVTVTDYPQSLSLTITLKSKQVTDKTFMQVYNPAMTPLDLRISGESGTTLSNEGRMAYMGGSDALEALLNRGESGSFTFTRSISDEDLKDLDISKFTIVTKATEYPEEETATSGGSESSASSSYSSVEIDEMLDSYDDYTDKYIKFYKKAMNGDAAAMSEYPALMEKAEDFANKLEAAEGDLTGEQLARMMEIQQKMMSAMSGN